MPSNLKRRKKASKRKKKKEANIHSPTNNQQGNDDLSTHDEKGSSSGDVTSPTSQEHQHHPLVEEEEERESSSRESSSVELLVSDNNNKIMEGSENGGQNPVEVLRELIAEGDSESQTVSIEHVEFGKESRNGDSSGNDDAGSSSGSSSDEESHVVEKKEPLVTTEELGNLEDTNSILETAPLVDVDPVEQIVWLPEEVIEVVEATPVEKIEDSGAIDLVSKEIEDKMVPSLDGVPSVGTSNGGENLEESEIPESSQNQQSQVSYAPPDVQPTSWKSCCGLLDVMTGSNR